MKKQWIAAACLLAAIGCRNRGDETPQVEARTIENTPIAPAQVQPPPTIDDQIAPLTPKNASDEEKAKIAALGDRVELPFAPAIAMDPVDGSKVSIRSNTPMFEYKKKIYYFQSAGNRQAFVSNPEQFTKGALARYQ